MDRQTVYSGQVVRSKDLLQTQQNIMTALADLAQTAFGTSILLDGFTCQPTSPASMNVTLGPGNIYQMENLEATAWSALAANLSTSILKQGIALYSSNVVAAIGASVQVGFGAYTLPASGQSQQYLIEAQYADFDGGALVLPYYNAVTPTSPFAGPGNAGTAQNTVRYGVTAYQVKAATTAFATGTTPTGTAIVAPDAGWAGLFVITLSNSMVSILSTNIAPYSSVNPLVAPSSSLIGNPNALATNGKLPQIPTGVQNSTWQYAIDTGPINALAASIIPAPIPITLMPGLTVRVKVGHTTTSNSATFNLNGSGAISINRSNGSAAQSGDLVANQIVELIYDGQFWQIANFFGTPSSSTTINNTYSQIPYATDSGSVNALVATYNTTTFPQTASLAAGLTVEVKVANTNTTSPTFNMNGLGAVTILDRAGNTLPPGTLQVGEVALLIYDGARWQVANGTWKPVMADFRGLVGTGASTTATWTIEQIIALTALGGQYFVGTNLSLTFNSGTNGANGMDTGSIPTFGDLSIYAIYNPTTNAWATLGTKGTTSNGSIYSGANMPSGYTASCLILTVASYNSAMWFNNQVNRMVSFGPSGVLNGGLANGTFQALAISAFVPAKANYVGGPISLTATVDNTLAIAATSGGVGEVWFGHNFFERAAENGMFTIPIVVPQTIYYWIINAGNPVGQIWISWYTF